MRRVLGVLTLALAGLATNQAGAQQLSTVETDKLRLLYFDPTETYLVPRVIQLGLVRQIFFGKLLSLFIIFSSSRIMFSLERFL